MAPARHLWLASRRRAGLSFGRILCGRRLGELRHSVEYVSLCPPTIDYLKKFPGWNEARGFKSIHPGGAHFVMADGSVHFVNESIDHNIYRGLSTRNGGETASVE